MKANVDFEENLQSRADAETLPPALRVEHFAAIDLGSNSFHMIVERRVGPDRYEVLDRIKEPVRLAEGLFQDKEIGRAAEARALDCLARFGERVRGIPDDSIRAVGTNALRRARNADAFLRAAKEALGHDIEIISGREEARLVYLGVCRDMSDEEEARLVFDIGGGSTEIIAGHGRNPEVLESANMGCVGFSEKFFPKGRLGREHFDRAILRARLEIRPLVPRFAGVRPDRVLGASGTVRSIGRILEMSGMGPSGRAAGTITRAGLAQLRRELERVGKLGLVDLPGLSLDRRPVLPGGLSILIALCEDLGIEEVAIARGALREGLLLDLAERWQNTDPRSHTIDELVQRFRVDLQQGRRVANSAARLLAETRQEWQLEDPDYARWLNWAAELHEVGLGIAHPGYHKHGAYIVSHSDMPGFSRKEQAVLSVLIGSHRRTLRPELFEQLVPRLQEPVLRLAVLLRVAFLLHRSREDFEPEEVRIGVGRRSLTLRFDPSWRELHALTLADLEREAKKLGKHGFQLALG